MEIQLSLDLRYTPAKYCKLNISDVKQKNTTDKTNGTFNYDKMKAKSPVSRYDILLSNPLVFFHHCSRSLEKKVLEIAE